MEASKREGANNLPNNRPILGLIGRKVGMSQVFDQAGNSFAATIIEVEPNLVVGLASRETRGYQSTSLAVGRLRRGRQTRAILGRYKHLPEVEIPTLVKEFREMSGFKVGERVGLDQLKVGDLLTVAARSKGKGFAGAIKRHNQHIGPRSHGGGGGSKPIRQVGSLGDISGNKVFKGMNMPGRMGGRQASVKNLVVVGLDPARNLLILKGSTPGAPRAYLYLKKQLEGGVVTRSKRDLVPLVWLEQREGAGASSEV